MYSPFNKEKGGVDLRIGMGGMDTSFAAVVDVNACFSWSSIDLKVDFAVHGQLSTE